MKTLFLSLFDSAPPPFICRNPTRHEWLGCRLVILAPDVETVVALAGDRLPRAEGIVLTCGTTTHHQALAPLFYHLCLAGIHSPISYSCNATMNNVALQDLMGVANFAVDLLSAFSECKTKSIELDTKLLSKNSALNRTLVNYEKTVNRISMMMDEQKNQKERLANIIDGTRVGTWEWNFQDDSYICNERWASMLGYTLQELSPMTGCTLLKRLSHPEDIPAFQEALNTHTQGLSDYFECEIRLKQKNGDWKWVLSCGKVISYASDRTPLQMFGTHQDIGERKLFEEKISRMNEQLAAKNKELEQILYVASHDLRAPLVNVFGFCHEMTDSLEDIKINGASPERLEDLANSLDFVQKGAEKMDSLLGGLLKLSRLGRAALNLIPLDMNELMERVVAENEFLIRNNSAIISIGPLPYCMGDAIAMNQVVTNLLTNAIKYHAPQRPPSIEIAGNVEKGRCVYRFMDNGIGIAPDHKDLVFDIFHRLHPHSSTGEGLGLSIVRQNLERMGGSVWLES